MSAEPNIKPSTRIALVPGQVWRAEVKFAFGEPMGGSIVYRDGDWRYILNSEISVGYETRSIDRWHDPGKPYKPVFFYTSRLVAPNGNEFRRPYYRMTRRAAFIAWIRLTGATLDE